MVKNKFFSTEIFRIFYFHDLINDFSKKNIIYFYPGKKHLT